MADASDAVDTYLAERFQIGLEQVLLDATAGTTAARLAGVVDVTCEPRGRFNYEDRGAAYHYWGTLTLEGITYRYRTWVFQDLDGRRIMTDLCEFSPVDWRARLEVRRGR